MARSALPEWMLLAALAQCATYVCAAAVWHRTLSAAAQPRSLASLLPLSVAKLFTDQAIPSGGFGGTLLVMRGLVRRRIPLPAAMSAVLVGMIPFYSAYLLAALASLGFLLQYHRASPVLVTAAPLFSVMAVGVPATILWLRRLAEGTLPPWIRRRKTVAALLKSAAAAPVELLRRPRLLAETIALQLTIFLLDTFTLCGIPRVGIAGRFLDCLHGLRVGVYGGHNLTDPARSRHVRGGVRGRARHTRRRGQERTGRDAVVAGAELLAADDSRPPACPARGRPPVTSVPQR
jgi:Lysylphosphatidylglycerol synthase TM region